VHQGGFSLIELMIAVVIVSILAAIAYPAYQDSIRKARRADAQAALTGLAAVMERAFSDSNTYAGVVLDDPATTATEAGAVYPGWAPVDEPPARRVYSLTLVTADATGYTVRATPLGNSIVASDGILELTSTGRRGWDRNGDGDTADSSENTWER
jgi:type IV pilus assembly protein PilE